MAYTNNDIVTKARELAPDISAERDALLSAMCMAAEAELKSRLLKGISSEEAEELFVTAAGLLAIAMLMESSETERISSFTAGSVSVSLNQNYLSAASLRRQAENLLKGYLGSGDFAFMGVLG